MKEFTKFAKAVIQCLKAPEEIKQKCVTYYRLVSGLFIDIPLFSLKVLSSCVNMSCQLLHNLYVKLPVSSKEQHVTDSIKVTFSIIFYAWTQFNACAKEHSDLKIMNPAESVQEILTEFLDRNYGSTASYIFDSPKEVKVHLVYKTP